VLEVVAVMSLSGGACQRVHSSAGRFKEVNIGMPTVPG
jgi:hypothetical protein